MNYDLVWKYSSEEGYLYKLDKRNDNDNFFELYTPEDDGKIESSEKFWNNRGEAVKSMDESLQ